MHTTRGSRCDPFCKVGVRRKFLQFPTLKSFIDVLGASQKDFCDRRWSLALTGRKPDVTNHLEGNSRIGCLTNIFCYNIIKQYKIDCLQTHIFLCLFSQVFLKSVSYISEDLHLYFKKSEQMPFHEACQKPFMSVSCSLFRMQINLNFNFWLGRFPTICIVETLVYANSREFKFKIKRAFC